jgi:hypothetical protein
MTTPKTRSAGQWPEADKLFHQDPRWRGSDDAYSIPLGDDRTLWLFGDTFVARRAGDSRRDCAFIRNSIAIQQGSDPTSASIEFHWKGAQEEPEDFFPVESGWLWPLHGAIVDGSLLLFFMRVRSPNGTSAGGVDDWIHSDSLSFFDVYGWQAILVRNLGDRPQEWNLEALEPGSDDHGVVLGAGVLSEEEWLYCWGWTDGRNGYVARLPARDAAAGSLESLEWWLGGENWGHEFNAGAVALTNAQTEFTIHRHVESGRLMHLQAAGLSPADLTIRWSERPEGPWTDPVVIHRIPESERPGVMGYAGKAHPQLAGADLIVTYASNGRTAEVALEDESIYYPRFVRVDWVES